MKEQVLQILKDKKQSSSNHCGTYPVNIIQQLGTDYKSLKPILNQLFKENLITIHDGAQGKLIKLK